MASSPSWLAEIQFALLDSMAEGVNLTTLEGELIYVNAALERMFGYQPGRLLGKHLSVFSADTSEQIACNLERIHAGLQRDRQWTGELRARRHDGSVFDVQARVSLVTIGGDQFMLCVKEDITRRKLAEQALNETQVRLQQLISSDVIGFIAWDTSGSIVDANDHFLKMVGYTRAELDSGALNWQALTPPEYRALDEAGLKQLNETGRCEPFEKEFIRKDGTRVPILIGASKLLDADNRGVSFVLDLTKGKEAEQLARAAEQRFHAFMDNSHAAAFIKDDQGRYVYLNRQLREQFSLPNGEWLGLTDWEFWPAELAKKFIENDRQVMAENRPLQLLETTVAPDGAIAHWQVLKFPFHDVSGKRFLGGMALDVTEQLKAEEKLKMAEEQFRHAQKMEAVGQLAGGVAHDFNNLLTIINGCSELLADQLGAAHPGQALAREINDAGHRAAALTRQLLAFSRRQMLQPKVIDVNAVLLHLNKILHRALGVDMEITMDLATDLGNICVDPAQFDQAIINLGVNARDAMPQGGTLVLQTRTVELDGTEDTLEEVCEPGRYVRICVCDNGQGMDAATQARIFEPFFTTKQAGTGTGLGLAMVYGFVRQSGGRIEVESTPGVGTRFIIDLPCVEEPSDPQPRLAERPSLPQGDETVLLVDDDEGVRTWTQLMLEKCGYRVLVAPTAMEALALAATQPSVDLLVTDVIMPKMSGVEVAEAMLLRFPEMKVLYISGYTDDAMVRRGVVSAAAAFLQKPFTALALATKVRELLDHAGAAVR
jgi:PAS domain S-box-containing protein